MNPAVALALGEMIPTLVQFITRMIASGRDPKVELQAALDAADSAADAAEDAKFGPARG
jgi:hypothetical protein